MILFDRRIKPVPAQIGKNGLKLFSECFPEDMSYISGTGCVRFLRRDEANHPATKRAMFAEIRWPSGQWQSGWLQIMNPELSELIWNGTIGRYGPPHVIFQHYHHGGGNTPGIWMVGFHANSILAQRYVLMTEQEFKRLIGPWAEWDKLMRGEEGILPHIY